MKPKLKPFNKFTFFDINVFLSFFLLLVAIYKVKDSALFGDDWPNSFNNYWARYLYPDHENLLYLWIHDSIIWTNSWIERAGRLIPIGLLLARIFIVIESVEFYKLLQIFSILLIATLIGKLLSEYYPKKKVFPIAIIIFTLFIQFRHDYDPYIGFTFILPFSIICILLSIIFFVRIIKNNNLKLINYLMIFILPVLSMLSYEYTVIFSPIFFYLIKSKILIKKNYLALLLATLPNVLISLYQLFILRPNRLVRVGTYESSLELVRVFRTYMYQLTSIIPNSQFLFSKVTNPNLSFKIFFICFTITIFILLQFRREQQKFNRFDIPLLLVGAHFLLIPPLLVGISKQWQEMFKWGNAYLPILYQHVGITILLSVIFMHLLTKININLLFIFSISLLVSLSYAFQFDLNSKLLFNDRTKENRFILFDTAISKGLFKNVNDGATIISYDTNDTHEVNRAFASIKSGIDLTDMKLPSQIWSQECLVDFDCNLSEVLIKRLKNQIRSTPFVEKSPRINFKLPIDGIGNYYGERYIWEKISSPYFMDALYYSNSSALFTVSPIIIENDSVLINRNEGIGIWVSLGQSNIFIPKRINSNSCLIPEEVETSSDGTIYWAISNIKDLGKVQFRMSENGQFCQ